MGMSINQAILCKFGLHMAEPFFCSLYTTIKSFLTDNTSPLPNDFPITDAIKSGQSIRKFNLLFFSVICEVILERIVGSDWATNVGYQK